ncbi:MAG: 8-amino-7-oxononanoate synthase [Pseudomonadota bacterium]|nr:8-amino-7-oxononanoate synthase [Pseudomonadota bacterium]
MDKKSSLDYFAEQKLASIEQHGLRRALDITSRGLAGAATRREKRLISFCCNDYLGLSQHPKVQKAAADAIMSFGAGAGASRLVTGNHPLYAALEKSLSDIKRSDSAVVFGSGYLANLGAIPVFAGPEDLCLSDALAHASMHAGLRVSGSKVEYFLHNDLEDCRQKLLEKRASFKKCLILTEGVFSMDGDRAPLRGLCDLAEEFEAWLFVDDAHGLGVLGDGAGSVAAAGLQKRVHLQMGTLSKSVGSYGGFLSGSSPVIDLLVNRARSLIYETGLPPAAVAASIAALDIIKTDKDRVSRPLRLARGFAEGLNLPEAQSAIVPLMLGSPEAALHASFELQKEGFLVAAIRPPTVPVGTARLRFTFCANHLDEDVSGLIEAIRRLDLVK